MVACTDEEKKRKQREVNRRQIFNKNDRKALQALRLKHADMSDAQWLSQKPKCEKNDKSNKTLEEPDGVPAQNMADIERNETRTKLIFFLLGGPAPYHIIAECSWCSCRMVR